MDVRKALNATQNVISCINLTVAPPRYYSWTELRVSPFLIIPKTLVCWDRKKELERLLTSCFK